MKAIRIDLAPHALNRILGLPDDAYLVNISTDPTDAFAVARLTFVGVGKEVKSGERIRPGMCVVQEKLGEDGVRWFRVNTEA